MVVLRDDDDASSDRDVPADDVAHVVDEGQVVAGDAGAPGRRPGRDDHHVGRRCHDRVGVGPHPQVDLHTGRPDPSLLPVQEGREPVERRCRARGAQEPAEAVGCLPQPDAVTAFRGQGRDFESGRPPSDDEHVSRPVREDRPRHRALGARVRVDRAGERRPLDDDRADAVVAAGARPDVVGPARGGLGDPVRLGEQATRDADDVSLPGRQHGLGDLRCRDPTGIRHRQVDGLDELPGQLGPRGRRVHVRLDVARVPPVAAGHQAQVVDHPVASSRRAISIPSARS